MERAPAGQLELQARKEHRLAQQARHRCPVVELPELLHSEHRWDRLRCTRTECEEEHHPSIATGPTGPRRAGVLTWLLLLILAGTTDTPVCACSAVLRAIQYIIPAIHGPEGLGRPSRDVGSVLCRESGVASGPFGGSSAGSFGGAATMLTARFLGLGPSAPVVAPVPASTARAGWSNGGASS